MKKSLRNIILVFLALFISSIAYAQPFYLKGREIYQGYPTSYGVAGATFIGNFFDSPDGVAGDSAGYFTLILGHNANGVELCREQTELISFKLIMNFFPSGRLVLVGPTGGPVYANWDYDDPDCVNGNCPLIGYADFLDPDATLIGCDVTSDPYNDNDTASAYIASVPDFHVVKQWFGSWGTPFSGGSVYGLLVHTPIVSPAIVGVVNLY